ncbi:MAG: type 4a pilus biogenesis protein PilO [Gemmatimonadota bacterium]
MAALNIQLPKDKAGQQKLLLGVLPFLIFFGYYQFMHGKQMEAIGVLETRLQELETRNGAARSIALTGGPELQQKLALYEQHMKRLEELIPKKEEVAALLNGLSERAMDTNVDLALMKPEVAEAGQFYTQQSYQITVIGLYHDVARYLAAVASLPRIVTPIELALKPRGAADISRDGTPKLQANFRIVTYVIPEAPEAPAAPPQGGASGSH